MQKPPRDLDDPIIPEDRADEFAASVMAKIAALPQDAASVEARHAQMRETEREQREKRTTPRFPGNAKKVATAAQQFVDQVAVEKGLDDAAQAILKQGFIDLVKAMDDQNHLPPGSGEPLEPTDKVIRELIPQLAASPSVGDELAAKGLIHALVPPAKDCAISIGVLLAAISKRSFFSGIFNGSAPVGGPARR
jgi:hypothetical protein